MFRFLLHPGDKASFFPLKPIQVDNVSTNDDICIFILRTYRNVEELICRSRRMIGGSWNYHEGQLCERPEPATAVSIEQTRNEHHGEGDTCLHFVAQSASYGRVIDLEGIDHLAMDRLRDSLPRVETLELAAKRYVRTRSDAS